MPLQLTPQAVEAPAELTVRTSAAQPASHPFVFHGNGGSLFGIQIVNIFLTLVTLGIYYFWGKVKVRNYLWSQTEFQGDRFAYHGTGKELLMGALKAILVFGVPYGILQVVPAILQAGPLIESLANLLALGIFMVFIPVAMVGARRYRLSRTSWRGVRFSFRGRTREFAEVFWKGAILTSLTLGLYYPFFNTNVHAFWVSRTYVGNRQFHFDGQGKALFRPYLAMLLLLPFTLGLSWFWFAARKQRYFWERTSLGAARFGSTIAGGDLLLLTLGNFSLVVLTLGLALPWAVVRSIQFNLKNMTLEGPLDLEGIVQEHKAVSATGEGLSSFVDTDLDIG
jgi:uncharacterized membrane protein YjgN (DUF898 family)